MRILQKETLYTIQITSTQLELFLDALKDSWALESNKEKEEEINIAINRLEEVLEKTKNK